MLKVMVIEDDTSMVSLLTTLLDLEGFVVRTPKNHQMQGLLQAIAVERPQVTLIDVNLNIGSGLDVARAIRRDPEITDTCILMTSGLNVKNECLHVGANGFIQKPFMPDELIRLIKNTYQQSLNYQLQKE